MNSLQSQCNPVLIPKTYFSKSLPHVMTVGQFLELFGNSVVTEVSKGNAYQVTVGIAGN
jgi:hypothetical protein